MPVPGDLIVIGAGVAAARGDLDPPTTVALIVVASMVGGIIQYALVRSVARPALLRILAGSPRPTASIARPNGSGVAVRGRWPSPARHPGCASSRSLPARWRRSRRPRSSSAWRSATRCSSARISGSGSCSVSRSLAAVGGALGPLAIAGVLLALLGGLGWYAISRRRTAVTAAPATIADWADACCPACLTLAALGRTAELAGERQAGRFATARGAPRAGRRW